MKFCTNCENMLYLSVDGDKLKQYCKNCNFSIEENYATRAECIVNTNHEADQGSYTQYMTKNIKYDPTLPRVNNIKCPHCTPAQNEVIYLKYDHVNMKYLYFCCHCEEFWK